jgi:uncharacterized membrane protein
LTRALLGRIFRRYLIAGLLVWLPIVATVLAVRFILELVDPLLLILPPRLRPEAWLGVRIPGLGAILAVLVLLATGLLVTNIIGRRLVRLWEEVLDHIPFVRAVYGGVKSFSSTILSKSGSSFKKVLLVEYPRRGLWSIGFQTSSDMPMIAAHAGEEVVCVFVPTTPIPTSGYIVFVPRSELIELSISVDAAMKLIVTLGVVVPAAPAP